MWKVWHIAWITAVCMLIVYAGLGFWMSAARPIVKTDYLTVINTAPAAVVEQERAWPIYRDALLAIGPDVLRNELSAKNLPSFAEEINRDQVQATEKFLNEHAAAIGQLREAANRPR